MDHLRISKHLQYVLHLENGCGRCTKPVRKASADRGFHHGRCRLPEIDVRQLRLRRLDRQQRNIHRHAMDGTAHGRNGEPDLHSTDELRRMQQKHNEIDHRSRSVGRRHAVEQCPGMPWRHRGPCTDRLPGHHALLDGQPRRGQLGQHRQQHRHARHQQHVGHLAGCSAGDERRMSERHEQHADDRNGRHASARAADAGRYNAVLDRGQLHGPV